MTEQQKPTNPYARAYAAFVEHTRNHQLVVIHEDGLYRHLRLQAPGTRMWSWDITTWPGHLATSGDIADGHVFSRLEDMIEFFTIGTGSRDYYSDGAPSIDVRYWAEKLNGGRSNNVKIYQPEVFLQQVREHLEEHEELGTEADAFRDRQLALVKKLHDLRGLDQEASQALLDAHWKATTMAATWSDSTLYSHVNAARNHAHEALSALWSTDDITDEQLDELIDDHAWHELGDTEIPGQSAADRREEILQDAEDHAGSENEAHSWLSDHEDLVSSDTWEWDLRDYDFHFLLTCYCIDFGVRLYREHVQKHGANDTYVHVRDGRVQNRPARPVIDVSFLDHGVPDKHEAREALAVRKQIMASPQAKLDLPETIRELTELIRENGDLSTLIELDEIVDHEMAIAERALARQELDRDRREREVARGSRVETRHIASPTSGNNSTEVKE